MKEVIPVILICIAVIIGAFGDMVRSSQIEKLEIQIEQLQKEK